jgi:hypothetical protein
MNARQLRDAQRRVLFPERGTYDPRWGHTDPAWKAHCSLTCTIDAIHDVGRAMEYQIQIGVLAHRQVIDIGRIAGEAEHLAWLLRKLRREIRRAARCQASHAASLRYHRRGPRALLPAGKAVAA